MLNGISPQTKLPRFVIRIRNGGKTYHYFRFRSERRRLPSPGSVEFAAAYSANLVEFGLIERAVEPARFRHLRPSQVYFIRDSGTGLVKIGLARDVVSRLSVLQVGSASELLLIGAMPGDRQMETELHSRFAEFRQRGEWFRDDGSISAFVATI